MNKIQLITFKGCQTTIDFIRQLRDLVQKNGLDTDIEIITVPSPEKAEEMGLYGSPTLLIDGREYQKQPFSQPGFY